jgi:2-polyprenyl-6-methoxyphenol hydroxylase-like FAD-dependent oxidoreductase
MNSSTESAVIGAGPVGSLTAISLAREGNEVALFEADASQRPRFAGEWLHPAGIRALNRAGVLEPRELESRGIAHRGFAIFPDDGSEPVLLDYPEGDRGLVCEHNDLVEMLRGKARAEPGVRFVTGARVAKVEKGSLHYRLAGEEDTRTHFAGRIVGADGRGSVVRPALGLTRSSKLISYMLGLTLHDIELPFEEYGHVILGSPGPILLYRISPDTVRASIDVPREMGSGRVDWGKVLREHYVDHFPGSLRGSLEEAIESGDFGFRANRYRPRIEYGNEFLSLVGDAVGFQHPLTAMGMTLGFQDAEGLARFESFSDFQKERRSMTLVPELLAMALYQAFCGGEQGASEVRKAIYSMWRRYPKERERTMRLLAGDITSPIRFGISFMRGVQLAVAGSVDSENYRLEWAQLSRTLGSIGQILGGLASCSTARLPKAPLMVGATLRPQA